MNVHKRYPVAEDTPRMPERSRSQRSKRDDIERRQARKAKYTATRAARSIDRAGVTL